jgi:hypothetical protein
MAASCLSQNLTNHIATGRWSAHTGRSPRESPQATRQPTVSRRRCADSRAPSTKILDQRTNSEDDRRE